MSAADLPETHRSSAAMARVLATYMDDPLAIRSAILTNFDRSPSLYEIRKLRADHLEGRGRRRQQQAICPHDGYWPAEASERAAAVNETFLRRLRRAYPARFAQHEAEMRRQSIGVGL